MITQSTEICWVASWPGDKRTDEEAAVGGHFSEPSRIPRWDDEIHASFHKSCGGIVSFGMSPYCRACGDENPAHEKRVVVPRCITGCWIGICDGASQEELTDGEDETVIHVPTRRQAEECARFAGWSVLKDGTCYCEDDKPGFLNPLDLVPVPDLEQPMLGEDATDAR